MKKIAALIAVVLVTGCGDPEAAKAEAKKYATDLGYTVIGVACADTDTDDDGYLSCSVRVTGQDLPLALECGRGTLTFAGGCKQAQVMKLQSRKIGVTP